MLKTKCNRCNADVEVHLNEEELFAKDHMSCKRCLHAYYIFEAKVMVDVQSRKNKRILEEDPDARVVDLTPAYNLTNDLVASYSRKYSVIDWDKQLSKSGFDAHEKLKKRDYNMVAFLPYMYRLEHKQNGFL